MFRFCYYILLILLSHLSFGQSFKPVGDVEKVREALRKSTNATNSVQADFQEEKFMAVLREPQRSSGAFSYQKSDKMRWEQRFPSKYIILIKGDKLRIREGAKEKNIGQAGRMASQIKDMMLGLVNGDFQDNKAFKQTIEENPASYQITLVPVNKRMKSVYTKINLLFSKNTMRLKELTFFQKDGDKSIMKFSNERVNQGISEDVFNVL